MSVMLAEWRRIVNHLGLLRTDRSQRGPSWRLSGERRDQTVGQASELAAGIMSVPNRRTSHGRGELALHGLAIP
jgi:hypothetical protein